MTTAPGGADTVGTARLDIVVDTSQFDAAINQAKRSVSGMSAEAQAEYNKLNAAEKRRVNSLIQQADRLKLTREQQIAYNAALRGTPTHILEDLKGRLAEATQGSQQMGLSQKQLQAAMRGTPAQITDIVVALQGGQRPITVFLQQGGQLKDMFGGIRPAATALASTVWSMVNPFTLAAVAVGGLFAAGRAAENDAYALNQALLTTGNYADTTAAQVSRLVDELAAVEGVTHGGARTALLQVAQSGRFAGEQFRLVADIAARMEASVGQSVDKTVAKFETIAKDPVEALLKLNETEHFLTRAQLDRVRALVEEGREQDAVAEGTRIYADRLRDVAAAADAARPHLAGMWKEIKEEASAAWQETKNFTEFLAATAAQFRTRPLAQQFGFAGAFNFVRDMYRAQPAAPVRIPLVPGAVDSAAETKADEERKKAIAEFDRFVSGSLTKRARLEEEIRDMRTAGVKAGKEEVELAKVEAAMRARFAEQERRGRGGGTKTDPTEAIVNRLRQQIALNQEQLTTDQNLTASQRMRVQVELELERIGGKATGTKRALIQALLTELTTTGELVATQQQELKNREALARQDAILAAQRANRRAANEADLLGIDRGDEVADRARRRLEIEREYTDELKRLGDRAVADDRDAWDRMAANARAHRDQQLAEEEEFQRRRAELMGDWRAGVTRALENYVADAENIAGQVNDIIGFGLGSIEDQIVGITRTGKFEWGDMLRSWGEEATRFATRQVFSSLTKKFMPGIGEDGQAEALSKSAGELAASGTVLIGAAAALGSAAVALAAAGAGGGASGGGGGWAGLVSQGLGAMGFAKGGVFTNKVVDRPTLFPFANGIGLMGEAGPEAIMPLRRLPSGRLGVEASPGASEQRPMNVTVNVPIYGKTSQETPGQAANAVSRELRHAARLAG